MRLLTKLLVAFSVMSSSAAFSQEFHDGPKTVNAVRVAGNGDVFVALDNPETTLKCFYSIVGLGNLSSDTTKAMHSLVMSARMANEKVTIEFIGNDGTQICPVKSVKVQER